MHKLKSLQLNQAPNKIFMKLPFCQTIFFIFVKYEIIIFVRVVKVHVNIHEINKSLISAGRWPRSNVNLCILMNHRGEKGYSVHTGGEENPIGFRRTTLRSLCILR